MKAIRNSSTLCPCLPQVLDDKKSAYGPWSKKMPKSRDDQSQKISILLQADFYMSRGPAELDHTLVKNITPLSQRLIMSKPKITESRIRKPPDQSGCQRSLLRYFADCPCLFTVKILRDDLCKVYRAWVAFSSSLSCTLERPTPTLCSEYTRIPDALIPPHSKIFTRLDGMQVSSQRLPS
jgi:hypothetical protein